MTLAESLKYWLNKRGMRSLNALATQSGVPYGTLRDMVKGITGNVGLTTLKALARELEITLDELVEGPAPKTEKAPALNEQELSEQDQQIVSLLPFVPEAVKAGALQIFAATVDLTAAAEYAGHYIDEARALAAQAEYDDKQQSRLG